MADTIRLNAQLKLLFGTYPWKRIKMVLANEEHDAIREADVTHLRKKLLENLTDFRPKEKPK